MKPFPLLLTLLVCGSTALAQGDFGDAPHCYPVTLAQNGARHAASALMLGPTKNNEADGRPDPLAQFPAEDPTDDGVELPATLQAGQSNGVRVRASSAAQLDAWIDWNHDGDWNDPGEQIFASLPVAMGLNSLTFAAPPDAIGGTSIARFRLSLAGGLTPVGPAPDGEVEDYRVSINAAPGRPPQHDPAHQRALSISVDGVPGSAPAVWTFSWLADPTRFTYLEISGDLNSWTPFSRPASAPAAPLQQSWVIEAYDAPVLIRERCFFRLSRRPLVTSAIPCFPGLHRQLSMVHAGITRTYSLFIPPNYQPGLALPLVFVLHGGGQSAASFMGNRGQELYNAAAAQSMILCFPDATYTGNAEMGWSHRDDDGDPLTPWVDDVAFLDTLTAELETQLGTNPARRYFAGFSSGGVMSYFMASRSTRPIAAIATCGSAIGGARGFGEPVIINPPVVAPVPVLIINLADDGSRPFLGVLPPADRQAASVAQAIEYWVAQNGLGVALPQASGLPAIPPLQNQVWFHRGANPPNINFQVVEPPPVVRAAYPHTKAGNRVTDTTITIDRWQNPPGDTTNEALLVILSDGGHVWPDAADVLGFDANTEVLAFFARH